eukprot:gene10315-21524_t
MAVIGSYQDPSSPIMHTGANMRVFASSGLVVILGFVFLNISTLGKVNNGNNRVLVVGGTGRVGRNIVDKLLRDGVETNCLVRNIEKARSMKQLEGANLFQGDVNSMDDLLNCSANCDAIIDVHGMSPPRFTKPRDLFSHPCNDKSHPYMVNYVGVKKIIAAMKINKISKIVRITGAGVGKSAFNPVSILFNLLLSMTVKWHERTELALRESGLNYTVLRLPEIADEPHAIETNRTLFMYPGDSKPPKVTAGKISIQDITDLCLIAAKTDKLEKRTVWFYSLPIPSNENKTSKKHIKDSAMMEYINSDVNALVMKDNVKRQEGAERSLANRKIFMSQLILSHSIKTTVKLRHFPGPNRDRRENRQLSSSMSIRLQPIFKVDSLDDDHPEQILKVERKSHEIFTKDLLG